MGKPVEKIQTQRKLTAILCADVAGYSRMMGEDAEGTLTNLTECREIFPTSSGLIWAGW